MLSSKLIFVLCTGRAFLLAEKKIDYFKSIFSLKARKC